MIAVPAYRPSFPAGPLPAVGIIGSGNIVRTIHLAAYKSYNVPVVAVYDISAENAALAAELVPGIRVYNSLEELLADPQVQIVDIGTFPPQRVPIMNAALDAGKHILAQKPLAPSVAEARAVVAKASKLGLKLAVNQNGRWAPAWRVATRLIQLGNIGEVVGVEHFFDINYNWIIGTRFDEVEHFALYDYAVHWFDITRCWLENSEPKQVRAREWRVPHQPTASKQPWGFEASITYQNGAVAKISTHGAALSTQGHFFYIYGTKGTLRGSVLADDFISLETNEGHFRFKLEGQWFNDGFAGVMGELMHAIKEDREPYNSARHNLLSLEFTLAAVKSAENDGQPVAISVI
jgi:predicted dehydrogenase